MTNEFSSGSLEPAPPNPGESFNDLLKRANSGDAAAASTIYSALYEELREVARRFMRGQRPNHTLQATALVHQAYIKTRGAQSKWNDRVHAISSICSAMRTILVDHERRRRSTRRRPPGKRLTIDEVAQAFAEKRIDPIGFNDQLEALAKDHPRAALVVELYLLFGYTFDEIARMLGVSRRTVERDWEEGRDAWR